MLEVLNQFHFNSMTIIYVITQTRFQNNFKVCYFISLYIWTGIEVNIVIIFNILQQTHHLFYFNFLLLNSTINTFINPPLC